MASPSPSQHHQESKSHLLPTVCLADWWLIMAENDFQGRRLAVAGYTSREKQAMRVFSSAPILKRFDVLTLETSDGICVILNGFMNKARTMESRFPSEVCDHFVFGFPPYWKDYDEKFISKDSSTGNMLGVDTVKKLAPQSEGAAAEQMFETPVQNEDQILIKIRDKQKDKHKATSLPGVCAAAAQMLETSIQTEDQKEIKIRDMQKEKHKATSPGAGAASEMLETPIKNEDQKITKVSHKQKKKCKATTLPQAVDAAEQILETPIQNKKQKMIKTQGSMRKEKHKAARPPGASASGGDAADKQKQKSTAVESSLSESSKACRMKTKAYETPDPGKEEVCDSSGKSLGFTRSRSGRLLVPVLKFWCNQRAIYDVDRTVTGIQECIPVEDPRKGSRSEPSRKRGKKM